MPDNLKDLQQVVIQRRLEHRGGAEPYWLLLLKRITRCTAGIGVLILAIAAASIFWPYIIRTKPAAPAPPAPAPAPAAPVAGQPADPAPIPALPTAAQPVPFNVPLEDIPTHRLAQTFTVGGWEYCVTRCEWRDTISKEGGEPIHPAAGSRFLAVWLTARNIGAETAILPPVRLLSSQRLRYEATPKAVPSAAAATEPIGPNVPHTRQVTFEVPADQRYRILVLGSWLSDNLAAVDVQP